MARNTRTRPTRVEGRGKPIGVQFFLDEDKLIRDLAERDGKRPVADMVRVLALEGARLRIGAAA